MSAARIIGSGLREEGAKPKEKIRAGARLKNHAMDEILDTLVKHAQRFRGVLGTKKTLPK